MASPKGQYLVLSSLYCTNIRQKIDRDLKDVDSAADDDISLLESPEEDLTRSFQELNSECFREFRCITEEELLTKACLTKSHISKVRQSAFYTISNLGRIKNILSRDLRIMLVKHLVLSKVDYHNALYIR